MQIENDRNTTFVRNFIESYNHYYVCGRNFYTPLEILRKLLWIDCIDVKLDEVSDFLRFI